MVLNGSVITLSCRIYFVPWKKSKWYNNAKEYAVTFDKIMCAPVHLKLKHIVFHLATHFSSINFGYHVIIHCSHPISVYCSLRYRACDYVSCCERAIVFFFFLQLLFMFVSLFSLPIPFSFPWCWNSGQISRLLFEMPNMYT